MIGRLLLAVVGFMIIVGMVYLARGFFASESMISTNASSESTNPSSSDLESLLRSATAAELDVTTDGCLIALDYNKSRICSNPSGTRRTQQSIHFSEVSEMSLSRERADFDIVVFRLTDEAVDKSLIREIESRSAKYSELSAVDRAVSVSSLFQDDGLLSGEKTYTCDGREYYTFFYQTRIGLVLQKEGSARVFEALRSFRRQCQ